MPKLTTGQIGYNTVSKLITPLLKSKAFTLKESKYNAKGIVTGMFNKWGLTREALNIYCGMLNNSELVFVPKDDRFAEEQICAYITVTATGAVKIMHYVKIKEYLGETSVSLNEGLVKVHNYTVKRSDNKASKNLPRVRDIIFASESNGKFIYKGLTAMSEEGVKGVLAQFPDLGVKYF